MHAADPPPQRDLKPQNLLLSDTSMTPVLKIADFGFARSLQPQVSASRAKQGGVAVIRALQGSGRL